MHCRGATLLNNLTRFVVSGTDGDSCFVQFCFLNENRIYFIVPDGVSLSIIGLFAHAFRSPPDVIELFSGCVRQPDFAVLKLRMIRAPVGRAYRHCLSPRFELTSNSPELSQLYSIKIDLSSQWRRWEFPLINLLTPACRRRKTVGVSHLLSQPLVVSAPAQKQTNTSTR